MGRKSQVQDQSDNDLLARGRGRHVVGQPDAAFLEEQGGADGSLVVGVFVEEVFLDEAQASDVAGREPVECEKGVVGTTSVAACAVDREIGIEFDEEIQVLWQGLIQPDAGHGRETTALAKEQAGQELQVRSARSNRDFRAEITEQHGTDLVAVQREASAGVAVEPALSLFAQPERREGTAEGNEQLSVRSRLRVRQSGNREEEKTRSTQQKFLHWSLQVVHGGLKILTY